MAKAQEVYHQSTCVNVAPLSVLVLSQHAQKRTLVVVRHIKAVSASSAELPAPAGMSFIHDFSFHLLTQDLVIAHLIYRLDQACYCETT